MKLLKIFLISLITLSTVTFAKQDVTSNSTSIGADNLSFVISATAGRLSPLKSGAYQLLLTGVSPYTTYYTRRPNRQSGLASMNNFVRSWDVGTHTFAQDNPNATLTAVNIDGVPNKQGLVKVLQLSNPQYNFSQSTLRVTVTPIGSNNQIVVKNENFEGLSLVIN